MSLLQINIPVDPQVFVTKFEQKFISWGNIVTQPLKDTWFQNALVFNNVIANSAQKIKYIVSAPTGSAKTENTITYCAMLPSNIKVLISTNLTDEADRLAQCINQEANEERACAYHSKNDINIDDAKRYQIVTVSHEFYRKHQKGTEVWDVMADDRELIIIDEALDTIDEYVIKAEHIEVTFNFFAHINKKRSYKNKSFEQCLKYLCEDLNIVENPTRKGTHLIRSNDFTIVKAKHRSGADTIIKFQLDKYYPLVLIIESETFDYNKILTTINDQSKNELLKKMILDTLMMLSRFHRRQTYMTANNGSYSLHRVLESLPQKSFVCFDATSDINDTYNLRIQFRNDLVKVPQITNVRSYSNVTLHVAETRTGEDQITTQFIAAILKSICFGSKTLIITHKNNVSMVKAELESNYSSIMADVVNWGAVTGLNKWQDFDTCVVIGLNHKPVSFVQNRVLINSNEDEAFGNNQSVYYDKIKITDLTSEIIQAINRIRVRKIIDAKGNCDTANIYLTLPSYDTDFYKYVISQHMKDIQIHDWNLPSQYTSNEKTHADSVVSYLMKHMKIGDTISINTPRDALHIKKESYKDVIGKTDVAKLKFKDKLQTVGFDIVEEYVPGSKKPIKKKFIKRFK